jgi:hypothetical protein
MFSISSTQLYLNISNCKFEHIILYNSKNILIENCSFDILGIFKSSKIKIKKCDIASLNIDHCNYSNFKECSIVKVFNVRSQANVFENCNLNKKVKKELEQGLFEIYKVVKQLPYIIIALGVAFTVITIMHIIISNPFGIYWYLSLIAFLCFIIVFIVLSRSQKKFIPNKIISNQNLSKEF